MTIPLNRFLCLLLAAAALALSGCASTRSSDGTTFVVVRHAEKATDDPEDPQLSEIGLRRAQRLAEVLADAPVVAVYATEFKRTRQTAQPTADRRHIPVNAYFSRGPAAESAARWRRDHDHGTVLIVGHSNTVPDLVTALSGQPAAPMPDTEYDRLTRIHVGADGHVRVEIARY